MALGRDSRFRDYFHEIAETVDVRLLACEPAVQFFNQPRFKGNCTFGEAIDALAAGEATADAPEPLYVAARWAKWCLQHHDGVLLLEGREVLAADARASFVSIMALENGRLAMSCYRYLKRHMADLTGPELAALRRAVHGFLPGIPGSDTI